MFVTFIGFNNKILNLSNIVMIEDLSTDEKSKVLVTTADNAEIEFFDDDADALLARAETILAATDQFLLKVNTNSLN